MNRTSRRLKFVTAMAVVTGGSLFQLSSCSPSSIISTVGGINPCGTVLACNPAVYRFIKADYNGPGVNPNVDIFCTYPPFCTPTQDPIFGGLNVQNP